jgi:hypothetical protein
MTTERAIALLLLAVAGCGNNLPAWTAAQVGCPAEEIVIMKDDAVWSSRSWLARCRGKTYACTEHNEGQANASVTCKERPDEPTEPTEPAEAPTTPETRCQFDTQCRGNRRCRDGRCIEPE